MADLRRARACSPRCPLRLLAAPQQQQGPAGCTEWVGDSAARSPPAEGHSLRPPSQTTEPGRETSGDRGEAQLPRALRFLRPPVECAVQESRGGLDFEPGVRRASSAGGLPLPTGPAGDVGWVEETAGGQLACLKGVAKVVAGAEQLSWAFAAVGFAAGAEGATSHVMPREM